MILPIVRALALAAALAVALLSPACAATAGAKQPLLGDVHVQKSVDCAACHVESPPSKAVPTAKCQQCHGSREELAAKTEKVEPNPHASHQGAQECDACHHAHKPSEDSCERCHAWGLRTP